MKPNARATDRSPSVAFRVRQKPNRAAVTWNAS